MSQYQVSKAPTPTLAPSKIVIINWLRSIFHDLSLNIKVEDFGDGVVYCKILNHFYGNPIHSKITWAPKNEYEYANNLKHVQSALLQLGITIPFDVNRIAKRKFLENWALINAFYRHFSSPPEETLPTEDKSSSYQGNSSNSFVPSQSQVHRNNKKPGTPCIHFPEPEINLTSRENNPNFQSTKMWDFNMPNLGFVANSSMEVANFLKENINSYNSSPSKGKWSVRSNVFQSNHNAVVDRVKEILLKGSHDTEKIRQIKMLLGLPEDEYEIIKIEDDDENGPIIHSAVEDKEEERKEIQVVIKEKQGKKMIENNREVKLSVCKSLKKPFKI